SSELWLRGEIPRGRAAVAVAGTAVLLGLAWFGWPPPSTFSRLPPAEAATLIAVRRISGLLQCGVLAAAGWLLLRRSRPDKTVPAGLALAGLAGLELLVHHLPANPP